MDAVNELPKLIGRYVLREVIGRGGMGAVYRAWDPVLEREVALKVIHPHQSWSERNRQRFATEAKSLARLAEPHVVHIFDVDLEGRIPHLVMEYVAGRNLRQVIDQDGPQTLTKVIDCAGQTLAGLAAAHAAGLTHRDLKPGNVLLSTSGVYKLVDFGLAHRDDSAHDLTRSGELIGTLRYLPPEVASGASASPAGDVYALGLTLYELATGRHPVAGEQIDVVTALRLIGTPVPSLSTMLPNLPADLDAWFARVLAHNPAQRFPDAGAALAALRQVAPAPDLPVPAAPLPRTGSSPTVLVAAPPIVGSSAGSSVVSGTHRPKTVQPSSGLRPVRRRRGGFFLKLILAIWVMSSLATLIAAIAISHRAISDQTQRLRMQLCGLASDLSLLVDAEAHGRLAGLGENAGEDPAFVVLRDRLNQFLGIHPEVRFVYTMTILPETSQSGVVAFVCDPSEPEDTNKNGVIDPDEHAADPGERYDAKQSPLLVEGFEKAVADEEFSSDQWGSWLSGYAPIRASDGTVTGLVGVDMPVDHIERLRFDFLIHAAILLGSTLVAFGAAGWLVALRMKRPIAALQQGMDAVARGDLEAKVVVTSGDEFQDLADSFEHMRRQLSEAQAVRAAFEAFVARTLSTRQGAIPGAEVHRAVLYLDIERLRSQQIREVMPRLLNAVFEHGGMVERTVAEGFVAAFPLAHLSDCPEERALRAALSMLAGEHAQGLRIGIDAGLERERTEVRAIALAQANDRIGSDLMVSAAAFAPARSGFYADRCDLGPVLAEGWAVKGAVSAQ